MLHARILGRSAAPIVGLPVVSALAARRCPPCNRAAALAVAAPLGPTAPLRAPAIPSKGDLVRQHKLAKQRELERRQLERQGIDPDTEENDDQPWVDAEEQARIDAENAERERERRAKEDAIRAQRDKDDAAKKEKWNKWRAAQIATTQKSRQAVREAKEARANARNGFSPDGVRLDRAIVEDIAEESLPVDAPAPAAPPPAADAAAAPTAKK
jgi:hypothetical protein